MSDQMNITVTDEGLFRKVVVVHITDTVNGTTVDLKARGRNREDTLREALRAYEITVENLSK